VFGSGTHRRSSGTCRWAVALCSVFRCGLLFLRLRGCQKCGRKAKLQTSVATLCASAEDLWGLLRSIVLFGRGTHLRSCRTCRCEERSTYYAALLLLILFPTTAIYVIEHHLPLYNGIISTVVCSLQLCRQRHQQGRPHPTPLTVSPFYFSHV
jgi:hypothetical protein